MQKSAFKFNSMVRFKNRYLLFELQFEDQQVDESLTSFDVFRTLRESVQSNFGDFSAGALLTSLNVKYFNALTNLCIVRSSRDNHGIVRATASMMKIIKGRNVSLTCVHVSGTIRSCQEAAIRYNQQILAKLVSAATTSAQIKEKATSSLATNSDLDKLTD